MPIWESTCTGAAPPRGGDIRLSFSNIVNEAVRAALGEDTQHPATFDNSKEEPLMNYQS